MPTHHTGMHGRISKRRVILAAAAGLAVLVGLFFLFQYLEDTQKKPDPTGDYNTRHQYDETVERNGHTYRKKTNLTTILLLGIDDYGKSETAVINRAGGQADFLRLLIIDEREKKISQLAIDRDTMTPITILGVLGGRAGTRTEQISLSHAFGNGKEQSCELTREAVENLLLGIRIDYYIAMNLDFVAQLNDALGGVTVTIEDDFKDPALKMGEKVTLRGSQAETFVRSRMSVGDGTNVSRMRRQQQYIESAAQVFSNKLHQDENFVGALYDELTPYMVKNISKGRLVLEAYDAKDYARPAVYQLAGEHKTGDDGFTEFHADEKKLEETVLQLFYDPLN